MLSIIDALSPLNMLYAAQGCVKNLKISALINVLFWLPRLEMKEPLAHFVVTLTIIKAHKVGNQCEIRTFEAL